MGDRSWQTCLASTPEIDGTVGSFTPSRVSMQHERLERHELWCDAGAIARMIPPQLPEIPTL